MTYIPSHWQFLTNWPWLMYRITPLEYVVWLTNKQIEEDEPGEPVALGDEQ